MRHDTIVSSRALEVARSGGQPVPLAYWSTVDRLFEIVRNASVDDIVVKADVTYDPDYGFPTRIAIQCRETVLDCGSIYEARNLKGVP